MDILMSKEKQTKPPAGKTAEVAGDETPPRGVEVLSLEIDEDFDLGSDPYNRTGSHCIIKIDDDG